MHLSTSVKTALAILVALTVYFGVRTIFSDGNETAPAIAGDEPFTVIAKTIKPASWRDEIIVRGRTEALRKVTVRAETAGVVAKTPVEPGSAVAEGDVLCLLRVDARRAALNEAQAALAKAELDHNAAVKLAEEGFRAETNVAAAKAALDLARADYEQARLALERTKITAPFAGIFDTRLAEAGDFLSVGDACGVLIQQTPFLVVGAVSEREVAKIKKGDRGVARLATGETVEGRVRVVAISSDPSTRTFEVQLEAPNPDGAIRDGVTAEFTIFAERREAHLAPRAALTLDDEGRVGLRLVDAEGVVSFVPVSLLGEDEDGVWVAGLNGSVQIITRGQDYVAPGEKVAVVIEESAS